MYSAQAELMFHSYEGKEFFKSCFECASYLFNFFAITTGNFVKQTNKNKLYYKKEKPQNYGWVRAEYFSDYELGNLNNS